MPELPEVETIRCSIEQHLAGSKIVRVAVRTGKLRQLIPQDLNSSLAGQYIRSVQRRGKYLLLHCTGGTLIIHLGMTGTLYVTAPEAHPEKHDHMDLVLDNGLLLRFRDPRRFGTVLWTTEDPFAHPLLAGHGPEPLQDSFTGDYLSEQSRRRTIPIKQLIMDGNIYAGESLFLAGILPQTAAKDMSQEQCRQLTAAIKEVLAEAVSAGVKSITGSIDGTAPKGYFPYRFRVYGREGAPCFRCGAPIAMTRLVPINI